ncbi:hypothetical protein RF11_02098 [Thelohanellus kitauei]|uniref:Uncharacterized protein n=1 Tax=Thelohanellus kitauei TaxID=669202 RepID=A0A0C2MMZ4_THEKT|nr:hypothetical protein RF11_02098 [Thelohanellus kitauei]
MNKLKVVKLLKSLIVIIQAISVIHLIGFLLFDKWFHCYEPDGSISYDIGIVEICINDNCLLLEQLENILLFMKITTFMAIIVTCGSLSLSVVKFYDTKTYLLATTSRVCSCIVLLTLGVLSVDYHRSLNIMDICTGFLDSNGTVIAGYFSIIIWILALFYAFMPFIEYYLNKL